MKKDELLKEDWVEFKRFYCKKGFIDRWMGDSASNPNRDKKSLQNLNKFASYFRFNGSGLWIHSHDFSRNFLCTIFVLQNDFTSDDIWLNFHTKDTKNIGK